MRVLFVLNFPTPFCQLLLFPMVLNSTHKELSECRKASAECCRVVERRKPNFINSVCSAEIFLFWMVFCVPSRVLVLGVAHVTCMDWPETLHACHVELFAVGCGRCGDEFPQHCVVIIVHKLHSFDPHHGQVKRAASDKVQTGFGTPFRFHAFISCILFFMHGY